MSTLDNRVSNDFRQHEEKTRILKPYTGPLNYV